MSKHIVVSDESGIDQTVQSLGFVAGPWDAIIKLNQACKVALKNAETSEIKFKDIDDARRREAAKAALTAFLDCPSCRAMVMTWNLGDKRHKIERRDDNANFHRMLFHGLRSVADWFGDVDWHWYPDRKTDLNEIEIASFLNNTRGYRALSGMPVDLFGDARHMIRFAEHRQRCSREVAIIGLADLLAGAVRHSVVDSPACVEAYRSCGGQAGLPLEDLPTPRQPSRGEIAKREVVGYIRDQCGQRRLGVSLESTGCLATHKKGSKIWIWHYEPQGAYDKAPTKPRRGSL